MTLPVSLANGPYALAALVLMTGAMRGPDVLVALVSRQRPFNYMVKIPRLPKPDDLAADVATLVMQEK